MTHTHEEARMYELALEEIFTPDHTDWKERDALMIGDDYDIPIRIPIFPEKDDSDSVRKWIEDISLCLDNYIAGEPKENLRKDMEWLSHRAKCALAAWTSLWRTLHLITLCNDCINIPEIVDDTREMTAKVSIRMNKRSCGLTTFLDINVEEPAIHLDRLIHRLEVIRKQLYDRTDI